MFRKGDASIRLRDPIPLIDARLVDTVWGKTVSVRVVPQKHLGDTVWAKTVSVRVVPQEQLGDTVWGKLCRSEWCLKNT